MRNKKVLVGLVIVLLLIIVIIASRGASDVDQNGMKAENGEEFNENEEAALMNNGIGNGAVASVSDASLIGVWRSTEDSRYILEFASGGIAREYYAQKLSATGSWSINNGVLTTRIGGAVHNYDLLELSNDGFKAKYQTSDAMIEFNKVEL